MTDVAQSTNPLSYAYAHDTSKLAIVLGCQHGGLAVIRALGRQGIQVIGVTHKPQEFGLQSKYLADYVICPHPEDTDAFANFLLKRGINWDGALIIETVDYYATAIAKHKEAIKTHYHIVTPDEITTQIFIEKNQTYALAAENDVPYPLLFQPNSLEDVEARLADIIFPVMIKPVKSHEFVDEFGEKLFIVKDEKTLRQQLIPIFAKSHPIMIQEIIPGDDDTLLESIEIYVNSKGDIAAELFYVKYRQTPPMFGVMRVGRSVPPIEDIRDYAHRILRAVNYRGFASFEFKRDPRDGVPKLIEVNIRQPRNGQLLTASGINFPWIIYQDLVCDNQLTMHNYTPTYYIDLIPDIGNSIVREPHKLINIGTMARPYLAREKTFAVWSRDDPKPFASQIQSKLRKINPLAKKS